MKLIYERKKVEISDLPNGKYLLQSSRFSWPTCPLVDKDELGARINKLGYGQDEVKVQGPFKHLNCVPAQSQE